MNTNKYLSFFVLLLLARTVFGQQSIPVDKLTGRLAVTIPITDATEGSLSAPIYLRYSGGGVKIDATNGTAGLGWDLQAGGAVVRELRGLPDDYSGSGADTRLGWRMSTNAADINGASYPASTCAEETTAYNFISGRGYTRDTEPDLFSFSAPGLSGQFVFDATGQIPKFIPYQDLSIFVNTNATTNQIDSFTITTNEGIVYVFGSKATTTRQTTKPIGGFDPKYFRTNYEYFKTPLTFTSSWGLVSITAPDGSDIVFSYVNSAPETQTDDVNTYNETNVQVNHYTITDQATFHLINQISTALTTINFTWDANLIESIKVTENNFSSEKTYHFTYIKAVDASGPSITPNNRAFLNYVMQEKQCSTYPAYTFSYYGMTLVPGNPSLGLLPYYTVSLPFYDGKKRKDFWGYANATVDAATEAPPIYYTTSSNAERYRIATVAGATLIPGGNRVPTTTVSIVNAASLKDIFYPTGAKATIEYEPNSYVDDLTASTQTGGGIRVSRVTVSDIEHDSQDIITNYEYTQVNGTTSGKLTYRPVFAFADGSITVRSEYNLGPEPDVLYTRTAIRTSGKGKTVYDFLLPAMYSNTLPTAPDWTATVSKMARLSCGVIGNQLNGAYTYPFPPNTNYDFERGLPQTITDFTEAGVEVQKRDFTYTRLPVAAAPIVNIKGLRFEKQENGSYTNYMFGHYTLIANTDKVVATETTSRADEITPANKIVTITNYVYSSVHSLLESMNTTNSASATATENIIYRTKYRYVRDFMTLLTNPNLTDPETAAIVSLNNGARKGTLLETIQTRSVGTLGTSETVIGASLTTYKAFGTKILPNRSLSLLQASGFPLAGTGVAGSPQALAIDNNRYLATSTIQTYSSNGIPLSVIDQRSNKSGVHYGYSNQMAVASIKNAYAEEVVYDGFESGSTNSLGVSSAAGTWAFSFAPESWAGNTAMSLTSTGILSKTGILRGSNKYRASCWVKAVGAATVTFKVTGSTIVNGTMNYNSNFNQWQYLTTDVIMPAGTTFTLDVSANASVIIDEVRFQPFDSEVITSSYNVLYGKSAQINNRGDAVFTDYDVLGRPNFIRNKNKDIVQIKEYRFKAESKPLLNSEFSVEGQFFAGSATQLVSVSNCIGGGLTYQWLANGVLIGTGTLTSAGDQNYIYYTPPATGNLIIKLVVSHPSGAFSETEKVYCIGFPLLTFSLTVTDEDPTAPSSTSYSNCRGGVKTFTVIPTGGGCGTTIGYAWKFQVVGSSNFIFPSATPIVGGGSQIVISSHSDAFGGDYQVFCDISQTCPASGTCLAATSSTQLVSGVDRIPDEPFCQ